MKKLKKYLIFLMVLSVAVSMAACAGEKAPAGTEEPTLGLRYAVTEEMTAAGITLVTDGLSTVNDVGEMDVVLNGEILEVILVMEQGLFGNYVDGMNAEEFYRSNYPEFVITSAMHNDYVYIYLDFSPTLDLTASGMEQAVKMTQEFVASLEYIPVDADKISVESLSFETVNLDGEPVTDAILGEKDITILNVWATYCNPCINEMPDLAAWEKELPENVQILYLCSDLRTVEDGNKELADSIVDKSGINRKNVLLMQGDTFEELYPMLSAVPTTLFIDKEGKLSDNIVVGAYLDQYKEALQELLSGR